MNLKEAFRYQNKLNGFIDEVQNFLLDESNIVSVETTHLRKKVMPEAENETVIREKLSEYGEHANEMMAFLLCLLEQKELLSKTIHNAKAALPIDMDSEVSLNEFRRRAAGVFGFMTALRATETVVPGGGTGYRFNAEGNQVSYRCDLRRVTTIDFDRNAAKKYMAGLNRKADEISVRLDEALINSQVDYEAPFDVNASFADVFEDYLNN